MISNETERAYPEEENISSEPGLNTTFYSNVIDVDPNAHIFDIRTLLDRVNSVTTHFNPDSPEFYYFSPLPYTGAYGEEGCITPNSHDDSDISSLTDREQEKAVEEEIRISDFVR